VILGESRRLQRLVQDLLDLARLDAHRFSLDLGPVEVADVAREIVAGFRGDSAASEVAIEVVAPDAEVWARADHDRLGQVVANLVENALKFARRQAVVKVAVLPGGPGGRPLAVLLTVTDDGPGIEPDDLPHVFERLYVTKKVPARKEVGSGLGLAIVRDLVGAMGGRVWAEPADGQGTRIVVILHGDDAPPPEGQTNGSSRMRAEANPSPHSTDAVAGSSTPRGT